MRMFLHGELQHETFVFGAIAGTRINKLELDVDDVQRMAQADPELLSKWLRETVLCRFETPPRVPG